MENLIHFIVLILEYCLLPIFLFLITYQSDDKTSLTESENYLLKLKGSGYDFILIEAFAFFSLSLRIASSENFHKEQLLIDCGVLTILTTVYLFTIFFIGFINKDVKRPITVKIFRLTFNSAFVTWWLSILILGVFSHYLLDLRLKADCSLFALFIVSLFGYKQTIKKYFITEEVMFLEYSSLIENFEYEKSQKKGYKLVKKLKKKKGLDGFKLMYKLVNNMGFHFYRQNDKLLNDSKVAINLMREVQNNSHFHLVEEEGFYKILAGLYVNLHDNPTAITLIENNVVIGKERCLECIRNNRYDDVLASKHVIRS